MSSGITIVNRQLHPRFGRRRRRDRLHRHRRPRRRRYRRRRHRHHFRQLPDPFRRHRRRRRRWRSIFGSSTEKSLEKRVSKFGAKNAVEQEMVGVIQRVQKISQLVG